MIDVQETKHMKTKAIFHSELREEVFFLKKTPWFSNKEYLLSYTRMYISSSSASLSPGRLFLTPWTVAHQAPLSMGFSRQEYWSG